MIFVPFENSRRELSNGSKIIKIHPKPTKNELWSGPGGAWSIENRSRIIQAIKVFRAGCFFMFFTRFYWIWGTIWEPLGSSWGPKIIIWGRFPEISEKMRSGSCSRKRKKHDETLMPKSMILDKLNHLKLL